MIQEIWRPVKEYEGLYEVSSLGQVKSLKRKYSKKEKLLTPYKNDRGYLVVYLCKNGSKKCKRIQRLVAIAFLENRQGLPFTNHKNGIQTDNNVKNLEWCDHSHNMKHAYEIGLNNPKFQRISRKNSTSKYVGVSWYDKLCKWCARIGHKRKTYHLGYFNSEKEAYNAYLKRLYELGLTLPDK